MPYHQLFTPIRLGAVTLPNRIVMAPMTRNRSPGHVPNQLNAVYYAQRASAGLIVTEGVPPSAMGQGYIDVPGLYTDEQVVGWRQVTDAVHERGGRIFAQLMYVGRVSHPDFLGGAQPVGPSAVRAAGHVHTYEGPKDFVVPRPLNTAEIAGVVEDFANAARRAIRAGFDGVELHGANGYLLDQFLSANANRRTDAWGGSIVNRARLLLTVVDAVSTAIGSGRVGVRVSPGSTFNDIDHGEPEPLIAHVASALGSREIAYLHVVGGADDGLLGLIRARYEGPLIANGGYTAETGEALIAGGRADLVSFGVPFIANPDLPLRWRMGFGLNQADPNSFYGGGAEGYTDYPAIELAAAA